VKLFRIAASILFLTSAAGAALSFSAVRAADSQWAPLGSQVPGSPDTPVWSIGISPAHSQVLLLATQGRGVLRSTDGGSNWTRVLGQSDAAWVVRFDPALTGVVYAGTPTDGLWKSTDEGKTWARADQGLDPDVRAIDIGPNLVMVGTAHGVFSSSDGAVTWHSLGLQNLDIAAVAIVAGADTPILFAGADNGTSGGYLQTASGQGTSGQAPTWSFVKGSFPADATIASLVVGPPPSGASGHSIYAGTSQGLLRSDDSGTTWTTSSGLPQTDVNAIAVNAASGDQVYIGSDGDQGQGGIFRSLDHGNTWSPLSSVGLPHNPRVTALALESAATLQVLADTWNPSTGQVGLYRIPDESAAVAGSAAPTASASARATPAPSRRPQPVLTPAPAAGFEFPTAWSSVGIGAAVLIFLVVVVAFRRWRMRREDLRTYRAVEPVTPASRSDRRA
jgi:photosystem II stability/assembly factor-like uncharacterized protein